MNFLVYFCIFIIILFVYVHINEQYKKSEDLEVYEMDYTSNAHLQTICNLRQPILFKYMIDDVKIVKESAEIKIWDTDDYYNEKITSVSLPFSAAETLFKTDPKGHYFTEKNPDFLEENNINLREQVDTAFKPNFSVLSKYEFICGSPKAHIPLRFHTFDRKFICVTTGKIIVKMTPWISRKLLHPIYHYETYNFYSKINTWDCQDTYKNDMDKIRFLEFEVLAGYTLYIPPYWWYSIQFSSVDTHAIGIEYQTPANICANSLDIFKHYIQIYNTKTVPVKKLENVTTI